MADVASAPRGVLVLAQWDEGGVFVPAVCGDDGRWYGWLDVDSAPLAWQPLPTSAPATEPPPDSSGGTDIGSGPDTLELTIAEDQYKGHAQFTVSIDGQQIGGTQTASASKSAGQSEIFRVKGTFGTTQHACKVDYINNLYEGDGKDRNLYLLGARYRGADVPNSKADMMSGGPFSFSFGRASSGGGGGGGGTPPPGDFIDLRTLVHMEGGPMRFASDGSWVEITVRPGDHPAWDDTCEFGGLSHNANWPLGTVIHFDYFVRFGGDPVNSSTWSLAAEMHAENDIVGRPSNPPISLQTQGDELRVCWIAGGASQPEDQWFWSDDAVPIVRGKDHHVQIDCKLCQDKSGFLKYVVDGRVLVDYHGVLGYNSHHYYLPDYYRANASETVVVTYKYYKAWTD